MMACRDLSLREVGEDLDAVKAVLAHFRRLNSMPDVPSAPRIRTREDLRF
jgi:ribosomal protein L29